MGVQITELLEKKHITFKDLYGKTIAIDAPLFLHQFLSTIRQRDGSLLVDSKGNVTSHLMGLFTRTTNLLEKGIKLIYVFDGKPPELKKRTTEMRKSIKIEAEKKYEEAAERGDLEEMRKYAARTSKLTPEMIEEAKQLIAAFGLPIVQALSEGEAQAAYIVKKGEAYAVGSQDADCMLFGATRMVRNLNITARKKVARTLSYTAIEPELIQLSEVLNSLGIDQKQLIAMAMLVGTDFNQKGIKGIGPKNALKMVKNYKHNFDALFKEAKWDEQFDFSWQEVFDVIEKMPVTDEYSLTPKSISAEKIKELLCEKHEFSEERVNSMLSKITKIVEKKEQKGLGEFF